MSVAQNAVIAILIVFFAIGIGALVWKGKKIVQHFAHAMFTGKQAQQEHEEQPPERRRQRSASTEDSSV
ncbi:hypothetical protein F4678DRAFT_426267 [Xylaria arbuscula]|nr:hypothetical protein F4678DRAFT_426267 [Xylaria arbuscula]